MYKSGLLHSLLGLPMYRYGFGDGGRGGGYNLYMYYNVYILNIYVCGVCLLFCGEYKIYDRWVILSLSLYLI